MKVRVSDSGGADELVGDLLRGDCVASFVDADTLQVMHPYARDERESRTELSFFLRAWQLTHPHVQVQLIG